ncbi:hypothetical protein HYPSUDRAFT_217860 [Hypholoma sublateritium FD-334 SS-4]|uniref:Uncharacterized protein n=1 Tax=Hypholoma sublateritium (strain FD-334 SS-4) TaxID=945553 RepID=A0A0D2NQE7_HYPSF|nr:hypothetical protein HYPSUDRAFT_217860 [Hypholoma sublateritium FD-334 SS-4]
MVITDDHQYTSGYTAYNSFSACAQALRSRAEDLSSPRLRARSLPATDPIGNCCPRPSSSPTCAPLVPRLIISTFSKPIVSSPFPSFPGAGLPQGTLRSVWRHDTLRSCGANCVTDSGVQDRSASPSSPPRLPAPYFTASRERRAPTPSMLPAALSFGHSTTARVAETSPTPLKSPGGANPAVDLPPKCGRSHLIDPYVADSQPGRPPPEQMHGFDDSAGALRHALAHHRWQRARSDAHGGWYRRPRAPIRWRLQLYMVNTPGRRRGVRRRVTDRMARAAQTLPPTVS